MKNLQFIDDKAYEECQVVMLPSEFKETKIEKLRNILRYCPYSLKTRASGVFQHLYVLSDEKIKEGDWFYDKDRNEIYQFVKKDTFTHHGAKIPVGVYLSEKYRHNPFSCNKIIATTDESLKTWQYTCFSGEEIYSKLPNLSQDFIKEYCKIGGVDEIEVEYMQDYIDKEYGGGQLLVNPDNTINASFVKEEEKVYSREEVKTLLFGLLGQGNIGRDEGVNWIKENLK